MRSWKHSWADPRQKNPKRSSDLRSMIRSGSTRESLIRSLVGEGEWKVNVDEMARRSGVVSTLRTMDFARALAGAIGAGSEISGSTDFS